MHTPSPRRNPAPFVTLLIAAALAPALTGCGGAKGYYAITVPESGRVYFTRKINEKPGGEIRFMDKESGARVRLSEFEIDEISREDYQAGIRDAGR